MKPTLKEVAAQTVAIIELVCMCAGSGTVHSDREIPVRCLDNEVVVVRHEAVARHLHCETIYDSVNSRRKRGRSASSRKMGCRRFPRAVTW